MPLPALGSYRLGETLGNSALGTTYAGDRNGAPIVVKVMEIAAPPQERVIAEFRARAGQVAALYHPGIVPLRDYGVAGTYLYAMSGFQTGGSLADAEARQEITLPMPLARVAECARQIGQTLHDAHAAGVVHGNLKPANLFVTPERAVTWRVLVGDFPLLQGSLPAIVRPIGQQRMYRYLAPEQMAAPPVPATDQFALATMVYEWITGRTAFDDVPLGQRIPALPIAQLRPSLAELTGLDTVFARVFTSDPASRYPSIMAFATELVAALEGIAAAPVGEIDTNITRPAEGEMVVVAPIAPLTSPSAFLLDAPDVGPPPDPRDLQRMAETEERARARNASFGGYASRDRIPQPRKPTTSEQELLAPPAPRRRARPRSVAPPPRPSAEPTIFEQFNIPVPRREALITGGKITLAATVAAAGIIGVARNFNGIAGFFTSRRSPTTTRGISLGAPRVLAPLPGAITALAWSPDSARLMATCASDSSVRLWNAQAIPGAPGVVTVANASGLSDASWAHDSHFLLVCPVGAHAAILNLATQQSLDIQTAAARGRWNPHQNIAALLMAVDSTAITLWDLAAGESVATMGGHQVPVRDMAWSPASDGAALVSGDSGGGVILWTGSSPKEMTTEAARKGHTGPIIAVGWAGDGSAFASASADGTARIWTPQTSASRAVVSLGESVTALGWAPTGAYLALGAKSGGITLWDGASGKQVLSLPATGSAAITSLSWSSDGAWIAAAGADGVIRVWDVSETR